MRTQRLSSALLCSMLLCAGLINACGGETKVAQCQKVGDIVNSLSSVTPSLMDKPGGLSTLSKLATQTATDLDALKLDDKKLSNLRSHLAQSMREQSQATLQLAQLSGPSGSFDDSPQAQAVIAQNTAASQSFVSTFNATQSYCKNGTAPEELTSQPAA
ncbi:hypothetical protein [Acaryochloris thomasi]|uniref:hypothetical protein n=1 Tax=Acaryochloris thomasi TaxID=2929456 RepID=UPI001F3253BE|nr:hypothetical protein [Acaryochloris thomasi]